MASPRPDYHERQHLLAPGSDQAGPPKSTAAAIAPERVYLRVLLIGYAVHAIYSLHAGITSTAMTQLVEGIICRNYNDNVPPGLAANDPRCKAEQTQAELSLVLGMRSSFQVIPGLLLSIPCGVAADFYGRRPVAFLSLLGCFFSPLADMVVCYKSDVLSPRWLWAVPIIAFMGGGNSVLTTMVDTMISDAAPEAKRAEALAIVSTAGTFGMLVSAPAAYWLLSYGEWHALIVSFVLWLPTLLVMMMAPETLHMKGEQQVEQSCDHVANQVTSFAAVIRSSSRSILRAIGVSMREMFWEPNLSLLLISGLLFEVSRYIAFEALPQYMTKRYDLAWKEANLWLSVRDVLQTVNGVFLLPLLSRYLTRAKVQTVTKDAWIARVSLLLAMAGFAIAGLARQLPVLVIGTGTYGVSMGVVPAMRSLLVATAPNSGTGVLFSTLEVSSSLAQIFSGPLMAASFRLGLHWGKSWLGLPLLLGSVITALPAIILFAMKFKDTPDQPATAEEEEAPAPVPM